MAKNTFPTLTITFTQDREGDGYSFAKGQTVTLPETSARHWLARDAAVEAPPTPAKAKNKAVPAKQVSTKPVKPEGDTPSAE